MVHANLVYVYPQSRMVNRRLILAHTQCTLLPELQGVQSIHGYHTVMGAGSLLTITAGKQHI